MKERLAKRLLKRGIDDKQLQKIVESAKHQSAHRGGEIVDLSDYVKDGNVKFGVISDTQLNSKYTDLGLLKELYHRFRQAGCQYVLHTGDLTDGHLMHDTHFTEVHYLNPQRVLEHVVHEYPNGLSTYFIGGNCDKTYRKRRNFDMMNEIDDARPDMHYLGPHEADVKIGRRTLARMVHPRRSSRPYTTSYLLQKHIDSTEGGDKPDILLFGFHHQLYRQRRRGVEAFMTGTLQHQTPWMRSKNYESTVGGWVLEVQMNNRGEMQHVKSTIIPLVRKKA